MPATHAFDTVNDVAILVTHHRNRPEFHVRYGLQITKHQTADAAARDFSDCQRHALNCEGY